MDGTQMIKGLLPVVTLAACEDGDTYGYEVLHRLRGGGLTNVGDASVYGTLQRLYESGFLSSYLVHSGNGPQRRYYGLTSEGRAELKSGRDQWQQFREVVTELLRGDEVLAG
jgi:PadR family transcriptional regulator PadR